VTDNLDMEPFGPDGRLRATTDSYGGIRGRATDDGELTLPATDLDKLSPREMVAGLMRGNRDELRLGYTWLAAAQVTADRKGLDNDQRAQLRAYGEGFAEGMNHAEWSYLASIDPEYRRRNRARLVVINAEHRRRASGQRTPYLDGLKDGEREDARRIMPATGRMTPTITGDITDSDA
jgi:hypothetical protein